MQLLTIISILFVFYAYAGYGLCLHLFKRMGLGAGKPKLAAPEQSASLPSLSVIITVRNEASVIREKIEATLNLRYRRVAIRRWIADANADIEVIVASDASDDGTDAIVKEFSAQGVKLVSLPQRGGKESAQKAAIEQAKGDILVFTDAKIELNEQALEGFGRYFEDPAIGAVSSEDQVVSDSGKSSGEGIYVRYEMWLRDLESDFNSLVGLSGSCFAVRRSLCANLQTDIPSDFALLIETKRNKLRGVHAADVIGSYKAVRSEREEFSRKVRTVLRGITTFMSRLEVLNPIRFGLFSWQIASHKLCRWLVPWWMVLGTLSCLIAAFSSSLFCVLLLFLLAFYATALIGFWVEPLARLPFVKIPLFLCVSNAAILVAWIKYARGERAVVWNPSQKGR
jgi:glycosyltransferase involved in cell wall biosynthesis